MAATRRVLLVALALLGSAIVAAVLLCGAAVTMALAVRL